MEGFEPSTFSLPRKHATGLRYIGVYLFVFNVRRQSHLSAVLTKEAHCRAVSHRHVQTVIK